MARNRFRNTINSFNGLYSRWTTPNALDIQAFYFLPVSRLPRDTASLQRNRAHFDNEDFHLRFGGLHLSAPEPYFSGVGELYFLSLWEEDSETWATRNRRLYTTGGRYRRAPKTGSVDVEAEVALQFGQSRASTSASQDLDHLAFMGSVELGYSVEHDWRPRVSVFYEIASGDNDPNDLENNRFDTLFGARRFAHGPTGIYGAFARSNIQSPGYSLTAKPTSKFSLMWKHRLYWLQSETDAWTTSGLRDVSGNSGSFVGHQIEARVRWDAVPDNIRFEIGAARLFGGDFIRDAPNNSTGNGDATYGYTQLTISF